MLLLLLLLVLLLLCVVSIYLLSFFFFAKFTPLIGESRSISHNQIWYDFNIIFKLFQFQLYIIFQFLANFWDVVDAATMIRLWHDLDWIPIDCHVFDDRRRALRTHMLNRTSKCMNTHTWMTLMMIMIMHHAQRTT